MRHTNFDWFAPEVAVGASDASVRFNWLLVVLLCENRESLGRLSHGSHEHHSCSSASCDLLGNVLQALNRCVHVRHRCHLLVAKSMAGDKSLAEGETLRGDGDSLCGTRCCLLLPCSGCPYCSCCGTGSHHCSRKPRTESSSCRWSFCCWLQELLCHASIDCASCFSPWVGGKTEGHVCSAAYCCSPSSSCDDSLRKRGHGYSFSLSTKLRSSKT
mmetsp:Transcript_26533/g.48588  ORF Transcript_26533/g.48588 Transcript_26533/m.48588 type:complete len:215 (-) Transcript_26533:24-668(-)